LIMSHKETHYAEKVPETNVYAVHGAEPEVQAYAMARYSRSALSMKESLRQINGEKAEKFLNTYYFQYGHRSIADLAHMAFAIEQLSLLAAIVLVDEQRWDGQERSTRYQDFKHATFYIPREWPEDQSKNQYISCIKRLFETYNELSDPVFEYLASIQLKPAEMSTEAYERTLRARAFDVCRYLLPLATNTSLGQIVNARTLENQIARLLSDSHEEVRQLGARLKAAATEPAYNVNSEQLGTVLDRIRDLDAVLAEQLDRALLHNTRVAPTLVKYADPNDYLISSRKELSLAARELLAKIPIESVPGVELLNDDSPEIAIATTLLYEHAHHSYSQIKKVVEALSSNERKAIIDLGIKHRGKHDELLRAFAVGQQFRFDILMDIGGFRDLHRHRRCIQIGQSFTSCHGFETPEVLALAGLDQHYREAMIGGARAYENIVTCGRSNEAEYVLPLGFRKRTLFQMDFAEVVYITELRTAPAGHFSYREIAFLMYEKVISRHPQLANVFRVHNPRGGSDLLKR
jgi:thymidylate synthase ThyX